MTRIMYFLLDTKENKTQIIEADNVRISIMRGSEGYLFTGFCGARCNKIYIDSALNTKKNEEWIACAIKPMCLPYGGELIFI